VARLRPVGAATGGDLRATAPYVPNLATNRPLSATASPHGRPPWGLVSAFEGRLEPHGDACLDQEPSWVVDEGVQRAAASQDRLPSPLLVVGVGVVDPRRRDVVELLAGTGPPAPGCDDVEDLRTAEAGDLHGTAGCEGRPWSLAPLWPADDVLPSSRPAEDFGALGPSTVRSVVAVRSVPAAGVMVGAGPKG
jgi:hypothetical protein